MHRQRNAHRVYRALLRLYPKAHRKEYGEQMVQTLDDMLADHQDKFTIWLRVGSELPLNVIEEHINNLEEIKVGTILKSNKRSAIVVGVAIIIVLGLGIGLALRSGEHYSATTYARIQQANKSRPACLQTSDNKHLRVDSKNRTQIETEIGGSITDALAGTNYDVYFNAYDGTTATGTVKYGSYYGSYNYTIKNINKNSGNVYVGGWRVTRFQPCKA
ncbi:MAG TPA: hypothetical protein VLF40_03300 [Candidatus Saccharimonadales bacterium]|nr:hypothetical protein [Candidatus Saccharimonadales bacterium]